MIEMPVYLIKNDVETIAHCGHTIHPSQNYYMLRTNVPKWISLCEDCVKLLSTPKVVNMKELVEKYFETRPSDGLGEERRQTKEKRGKFGLVRREEKIIEL